MSVRQVDPGVALLAARTWIEWGDRVARTRFEVESELAALHLTGGATSELVAVAAGLWELAVFVRRTVDGTVTADSGWTVERVGSPATGDVGGTGTVELRSPVAIDAAAPAERGRRLVIRALADTASNLQVRSDEFEVVDLGQRRYLVVLPGVTDLSDPDPGWSATHRSVRDLDRAAIPSWPTTSVTDNRYAQMVWRSLAARVPIGSELVLVGHSFGADAALDLAANLMFNGVAGYRVSHVVAAGYQAGHQRIDVPAATQVLVLQNTRDAVVIAESLAASGFDDLLEVGVGLVSGGGAGVVADLLALGPGIDRSSDTIVNRVFTGGSVGAGHHPVNYIEFLAATEDPAVLGFLAGLAQPGETSLTGATYAVDISVSTHET